MGNTDAIEYQRIWETVEIKQQTEIKKLREKLKYEVKDILKENKVKCSDQMVKDIKTIEKMIREIVNDLTRVG